MFRLNPDLLFAPFAVLPQRPLAFALAAVLNRALVRERAAGELAFLQGRVFGVVLRDTPVRLALSLRRGRFVAAPAARPDAWVSARLEDYLALIEQRQDPDTLFFQRRLVMSGDTDLGLEVKNLLDRVDPEALPWPLPELMYLGRQLRALAARGKRALAG
ncbi:MAG: SCP2 sterol-binding domain-containing protein [Arenicellales bacterium]|jgi:predicted lipid carrier protein YhbT|nr:sterol-binding protein [Acidiferrobacteraceae bacterium]MDP6140601.1 SCP2 sterol-binding domain-containing protein [Arenicellales bacterium]HCV21368.1 sterol-binding protein [Gammaproteobacteria bacterium]MDP6313385.1 SCP2 sterol-binding domain-containing protein [Arenicellales bacterium]MDP7120064.1 SCP2 sterol-binding domain-containing protein [Arenicellales bacterium]|tara:strand:+ start:400 stop:879 length:480 start_codon:yes stop_codon:yes gene_type:complete